MMEQRNLQFAPPAAPVAPTPPAQPLASSQQVPILGGGFLQVSQGAAGNYVGVPVAGVPGATASAPGGAPQQTMYQLIAIPVQMPAASIMATSSTPSVITSHRD
jgi:hypothetical protein